MVDNIKSEREWQHKILNDNEETEAINTIDATTDIFTLILLYGGNKGDNIISKMKENISNLLTTMLQMWKYQTFCRCVSCSK